MSYPRSTRAEFGAFTFVFAEVYCAAAVVRPFLCAGDTHEYNSPGHQFLVCVPLHVPDPNTRQPGFNNCWQFGR
jgi:hypothetical protein